MAYYCSAVDIVRATASDHIFYCYFEVINERNAQSAPERKGVRSRANSFYLRASPSSLIWLSMCTMHDMATALLFGDVRN